MTINDVISILLFIIPGILAEKISHKIDFPTGRKRNDFMQTVNGIALSFPILLIVVFYLKMKYDFTTITQLIEKTDNFAFLFEVCFYTLITSIIAGLLYYPIKLLLRWIVNLFRRNKMKTDDKSCWRNFIIGDNDYKFLEIIINDEKYKGFLRSSSLPDEEREIVLNTRDDYLYDPEYKPDQLFTKIKSTYIDLEKKYRSTQLRY